MKRTIFVVLMLLCLVFMGCPKKTLPPIVSMIDGGSQAYVDTNAKHSQAVKAFDFKSVYFEYNKFGITDAAKAILEVNAQELITNAGSKILLASYCDERGTEQYNLSLGQKRAESVKSFLIAYGVNANRITVISYGEERQVCSESLETCWCKNRFVKFVVK